LPDSQKISEKQSEYMNLIAEIMDIRKRGEKPVAYIRTYGCQQNVADSEKIKDKINYFSEIIEGERSI
jgi:tRNA-2-methylthio-N6-dimethylallyladenosine synthase